MTPRGRTAGFALIELLVSLALLSAITVLVLGGFQTGRRIRDTSRIAEDRGEADAAGAALAAWLRSAFPAVALDPGNRPAILFAGRPDGIRFVSLSLGEGERGGLILTDIGFDAAAADRLAAWTSPFRAATAWTASRQAMHAANLLDGAVSFELSYFGATDAASPPRWRAEWLGMDRLPAVIAARMTVVRAGRRQVIEIHVAPRQS